MKHLQIMIIVLRLGVVVVVVVHGVWCDVASTK